jgi:hypothetical protein
VGLLLRSGLDAAAGEPRLFLGFISGAVGTRRANIFCKNFLPMMAGTSPAISTTRSANDWQIAYQASKASVATYGTLGQGVWTWAC